MTDPSTSGNDIAILSIAGRFPGAGDVEAFWRNLRNGVEAVTFFSDEELIAAGVNPEALRDPAYVKAAMTLDEVDLFDAGFFGFSPKQAAITDPQHRLFMECAWEALERAGYPPDRAPGAVGVYAGASLSNYLLFNLYPGLYVKQATDMLPILIGNDKDYVATHVSYKLNLKGPSVTIQTACSTSLVAVHVACQSLLNHECDLAIAGGVSVRLPQKAGYFYQVGGILSPDGHCRAFDTHAQGTIFGSGVGIVVLKRLAEALRDGDNIEAVIKGSAINNDGSLKVGYTAPGVEGQAEVIAEAVAMAGVDPATITYVETHGTGTVLGDPIEVTALTQAFRACTEAKGFCAIGSVKTNIGHLESAAGIASLIKTVLALKHQELPPSLNYERPNPRIDFENSPFYVNTQLKKWETDGAPRRAGVSSFGVGGTNAHVILEEAPLREPPPKAPDRKVHLVSLSAKSEPALRESIERYRRHLAEATAPLADLAFTANTGRSHFAHRLAVVAATPAELGERLAAFQASGAAPGVRCGYSESNESHRVAFLFTGQGSQYAGMGRQLYQTEPTFRQALEKCQEILSSHLDRPLLEVLHGSTEGLALLDQTAYTQPALFAFEYALAELWRSWGIEPTAVLGHSVGEYAAACTAGIFSLEDGLKLIAGRGRMMQNLPPGGAMAAVFADPACVEAAIAPYAGGISIAAFNGPQHVVISGPGPDVEAVLSELHAEGIRCERLTVSHAFHSPLMEPVLEEFEHMAAGVTCLPPRVTYISNLTGQPWAEGTVPGAYYWRQHIRQPVRFAAGMRTLYEQGCRIFVEIGPSPVLVGMGRQCVPSGEGLWLASVRRGRDEWTQLLDCLGALYVHGAAVDWAAYDSDFARRRVLLPAYPFQKERHWVEPKNAGPITEAEASSRRNRAQAQDTSVSDVHPLLGQPLRSARLKGGQAQFESQLSLTVTPFLKDHQVYGSAVLPATAYIEMILAAAGQRLGPAPYALEDVVIHEALVLPDSGDQTVQVILDPDSSGDTSARFQIFSLKDGGDDWKLHFGGKVHAGGSIGEPEALQFSLADVRARCSEQLPGEVFYPKLKERGLDFGDSFRGVTRVWRGENEALGQVQLPPALAGETEAYQFHPALLDACIQVFGAALPGDGQSLYMPIGLERLTVYGRPGASLWSHASVQPRPDSNAETYTGRVRIVTGDGELAAEADGLLVKRAPAAALWRSEMGGPEDWLYRVEWQPQPRQQASQAHQAPDYLLAPGRIAARVQPSLAPLSAQHDLDGYQALAPALDTISTACILLAFRSLGWEFQPGQTLPAAALAERLGILPRYERLLARMLDILAEDGLLRRESEAGGEAPRWEVCSAPEVTDPQDEIEARMAQYPACAAELTLLERCGPHLADVLRGTRDPLQLLFPGGSIDALEALYWRAPFARVLNTLVQQAITAALESRPEARTVRILEIGAGTGGTTAYVLPQLPRDHTEYVYTDVSSHFTSWAQQKFHQYPFVRYQVLDIELDPGQQGLGGQTFDVILAANVLHATGDLGRTLEHVKQLLAPEGLLVMLEGTRPLRWVDLTFGLTEGWWKFTDHDLRPAYPLLPAQQWHDLLCETGFTEVASVPQLEAAHVDADQVMILARGPRAAPAHRAHSPQGPYGAARASLGKAGSWLIFAGEAGTGRELARCFETQGQACVLVEPGQAYAAPASARHFTINPTRPEDFHRLLREVAESGRPPCRGVIHLWSLMEEGLTESVSGPASELDHLESTQIRGCGSALHLVQALARSGWRNAPRLWLVTRGAQPAGERSSIAVTQAPLWGLGRVIALEHPELGCTCVDLPSPAGTGDGRLLFDEIWSADADDQVAFDRGGRYTARLVRHVARAKVAPESSLPLPPFQLALSTPGVLDSLELRPAARRAKRPGPGEVEVRVWVTGLNFRDVLNALGMRPGDTHPLGVECVGEIAALGDGVEGLAVGDEVIALGPASFSSFVITRAEFVAPRPAGLSVEGAATIPVAFLTAYYALHHLARMTAGERVLIHAAAGGVGLAAVQLAQRAGLEVFATAGSPEKRAFLQSLGVPHVMNSRSLDFAAEVMEATGGQGVDIVLNSLAGVFIPRSLSVLAPRGRFIEIGKAEIWDPGRVAGVNAGVSYEAFDLGTAGQNDPRLLHSTLLDLLNGFAEGTLRPLPHQVFPITEVAGAFRTMAQARHIGKILVDQRATLESSQTRVDRSFSVHAEGTYLITGGLGGLGLLVAGWLVGEGARHLVLIGRSRPSDEAAAAIREFERAGARILVKEADVASAIQMSAVFEALDESMPPVRGVIHAAGVLDDGVLLQQDWKRFARVLAPKVWGAWNLHTLTRDRPLDFFVLFSSTVSLLGSPGQGNHAAANCFLDSLAHYRRGQGLPALSVNWGPWAEVGTAARRQMAGGLLAQGIGAIPPQAGLQILADALTQGLVQIGVLPIVWQKFLQQFPAGRGLSFLKSVTLAAPSPARQGRSGAQAGEARLLHELEEAAPGARRGILLAFVQAQAARVLGLNPDLPVDPRRPLNEFGLDSLMAIELRNALGSASGQTLPATLLFDYPTVEALTDHLAREALGWEQQESMAADPSAQCPEALDAVPDEIGQLTEAEAQQLLTEELAAVEALLTRE